MGKIYIYSPSRSVQVTGLINPNQEGMTLPTNEKYAIDIALNRVMSIISVSLDPRSNVDSFLLQLHYYQRYYLEIKSNIGQKVIEGFSNQQANLIRIILLGTSDRSPANRISIKIVTNRTVFSWCQSTAPFSLQAACIPTRLPRIMRSPFRSVEESSFSRYW